MVRFVCSSDASRDGVVAAMVVAIASLVREEKVGVAVPEAGGVIVDGILFDR